METPLDLEDLHSAISDLARLYQFRSRDETLYFGVTVAQAYCLRALWLRGEMSMTDLARQVTVSVSTMTGVVDQLAQQGLVRRTPDPADRRRLHVALTPKGRRTYEQGNAQFMARLRRLTRDYGERDLRVVHRFLLDLTGMIEAWRGLGGGAERRAADA